MAQSSGVRVVLPGDVVLPQLPKEGIIQMGSGVFVSDSGPDGREVVANQAGIVKEEQDGDSGRTSIWVLSRQKLYSPSVGDAVVGTVVHRYTEHYEVDIDSTYTALLPILAFENASKRNRPMLREGDVVYGRVVHVDTGIPRCILHCSDASGKSSGYGPLYNSSQTSTNKRGMLYRISTMYAREILLQSSAAGHDGMGILHILGTRIPFEIAIGMNGLFWITSNSSSSASKQYVETCILGTTIQACESCTKQVVEALQQGTQQESGNEVIENSSSMFAKLLSRHVLGQFNAQVNSWSS